MAKVTIKKENNFTVISNSIFKDKNLSFKAKGILTSMLSCPDSWNYTIEGLSALAKDGKASVRSALAELEENGYLERKQLRNENGSFADLEYIVYEKPLFENPISENPTTGNPISENRTLLRTDRLNTEELNTDRLKNNALSDPKGSSRVDIYAFSPEKGDGEVKEENLSVADVAKMVMGSSATEDRISDLKQIIAYFIGQYKKTQNTRHIRVTEQALTKIVINYFEPNGATMEDIYDFESYQLLIDKYLTSNYKNTTKSLQHFMSGRIRENLACKILR